MVRMLIAAVLLFVATATSWGQSLPTVSASLRTRPRTFSQKAVTNQGLEVQFEQPNLPQYSPLRFEVPELPADRQPAEADLKAIMRRMNELQAVVDRAAKLPKETSAEQVIDRLRARQLEATGPLKNDLANLLIASLVNARRAGSDTSGQKYDDITWVWSYRRLNGSENWGPVVETSPNRVLLIPVLNLLNKEELQAKTVPDFAIIDPVRSGPDPNNSLNGPNGFDVINLHTHGLNVSPNWPADDIFREIHPGQLKFFIYQIPAEQPAGTYFYHPHKHGSVATLVDGGMAGPLIVRDPHVGLDHLGDQSGWGANSESILMFQQLTLYKHDENATTRFTRPDFFALKDVDLSNAEKCTTRPDIQRIAQRMQGHVAPPQPPIIRRDIETWVSGVFQPVLFRDMALGEIRRLRLIHAGVEDAIDFTVEPMDPSGSQVIVQVIAWDGIPLQKPYYISDQTHLRLSPGNRADVLVSVLAAAGAASPGTASRYAIVERSDPARKIYLATFAVEPGKKLVGRAAFVSDQDAASVYRRCAPSLTSAPVGNIEQFDLAFKDAELDENGNYTPGTFQINGKPFPKDQKSFRLMQTKTLRFNVTLGDGRHPLHIHVNPFRVPADPNRGALGMPTCEFWADTFLIQPNSPVQVMMPFNNWTGESVSHCHILDHEDAGMMNLIRIHPDLFSWPEFPLVNVMDEPFTPHETIANLKATWPDPGAEVAASVLNKVSVFFFMPGGPTGTYCPHCSDAVQAVSKFRRGLKDPGSVRVVAVSATDPNATPDPKSLGLLPSLDVLCSDPDLRAFESIALIDSTPVLADHGELRFPRAFKPGSRRLVWLADAMHGLFIVDPSGMLVSARRTFSALDDTAQIMHEVELAGRGREAILAAYSQPAAQGKSQSTVKRLELQRSRFEQRLKAFNAK